MIINDILTKQPFVRVTPFGNAPKPIVSNPYQLRAVNNNSQYQVIPQIDFIRQYYPSGHLINDPVYYRDKVKYDEERKQYLEQKVVRVAMPFQYIIATQHLIHLCGNDVCFELSNSTTTNAEKQRLLEFQRGWLDKNMEIAFYRFAKSYYTTGDTAMVFYLNKGKMGCRPLSFASGDTLYPHYDSITGKLTTFARSYYDLDEDGKQITQWVEVWDETYMYRYRRSKKGIGAVVGSIKDFFGLDGYTLSEKPIPHGFDECPVAYLRNPDGASWSNVQDLIDKFELALSHLCQNNMAYAFPIMVLKGDNVDIQGDIYGDVKAITMGTEDSAAYLTNPSASEAFKLQLDTLLRMIFLGSFTVTPPEVKSGDLPGVAIKLIYSPSIEKAIVDAKEFDEALDTIVRLFKYAYGIERGEVSSFVSLPVFTWIDPYVHHNTAELIQNLTTAVGYGVLSKETASTLTTYGKNDELERLIKEKKEENMADLIPTTIETNELE